MTTLSDGQIINKLSHYCGYQERCLMDIQKKLEQLVVAKQRWDFFIDILIKENFFDESRFVMTYISSKFRILKWGKVKIKQVLLQKNINITIIENSLKSINESAYIDTIRKIVHLQKERYSKDNFENYITNYLFQKGFEYDIFNTIIYENNKN